jgi:hypothetical protein
VIAREDGYSYIAALRSPDLRHTTKREGDTSVTVVTSNVSVCREFGFIAIQLRDKTPAAVEKTQIFYYCSKRICSVYDCLPFCSAHGVRHDGAAGVVIGAA